MAATAATAQVLPESRESVITLTTANLGPNPGYLSGYTGETITETGMTSLDDMTLIDTLHYGPDGFGRINNGNYSATQDFTFETGMIEFDLEQSSAISGNASPAIFLIGEAEYFFAVSEDTAATIEVEYDGEFNLTARDSIRVRLRRVGPGSDPVTLETVFNLSSVAPPGEGTVTSEVSLLAGERYRIELRGKAEVVVNNSAIASRVRFLLRLACDADLTTDGTSNGVPDGQATLSDFSYYLSLWSQSDPDADITAAGVCEFGTGGDGVDLSDFSCYLSEWSLGCP